MIDIERVKKLAKEKGITQAHICRQLGVQGTYLADVARGKNSMPVDRITKIARILDTTYEYLTKQVDDPNPRVFEKQAETIQEALVHATFQRAFELANDEAETLISFMHSSEENFKKGVAILKVLIS